MRQFCYSTTMDSLVFIYNAESGLANALIDTGRRIFRPEVYPCALCMITYGPFGMKKDWDQFIHSLHKNELPPELRDSDISFPCLLKLHGNQHSVLIDSQTFNNLKDLALLIKEVNRVLALQSNQ
jgi:hypothetical protein